MLAYLLPVLVYVNRQTTLHKLTRQGAGEENKYLWISFVTEFCIYSDRLGKTNSFAKRINGCQRVKGTSFATLSPDSQGELLVLADHRLLSTPIYL